MNTKYMVMVNGRPTGLPYDNLNAAERLALECVQRDQTAEVLVEGRHGGMAPITVYRYGPAKEDQKP